MAKTLQRIFLLFCMIFTPTALASCLLNLSWGLPTDTDTHIAELHPTGYFPQRHSGLSALFRLCQKVRKEGG